MSVVHMKDYRTYRIRLMNHFERCDMKQLKRLAKWWQKRDPEIWQVITIEMARR